MSPFRTCFWRPAWRPETDLTGDGLQSRQFFRETITGHFEVGLGVRDSGDHPEKGQELLTLAIGDVAG